MTNIISASIFGLEAHPVQIEVDISPGLPAFTIVGLPDAAVQEARERVRSALRQFGKTFPRARVTINLAPADLKKSGTPFDLPIALAILQAEGDIPVFEQATMIAGELGLNGSIRPIHGALSFAILAEEMNIKTVILPEKNAEEAALAQQTQIIPANHIEQLIQHLRKQHLINPSPTHDITIEQEQWLGPDFSAIRGQEQAKRALEIAAAGGHNVLMQGPPGSGKTLLARTFPSILPVMTKEEALEVTRIHSVAGKLPFSGLVTTRPFRAPHHSASMVSIVGGGSLPKPGEISLSHRGVLFLDEFLEFERTVLESLRQPLEDGFVTVSRAQGSVAYPAQVTLLAAMNPCPCGFMSDKERECVCTPIQIAKYRKRLSGPLLDRLDLFIEVPKVKTDELTQTQDAESSEVIRKRVQTARNRQIERWKQAHLTTNAELSSDQIRRCINLSTEAKTVLRQAVERFQLSARSYFRLLKVAQTIADLSAEDTISTQHLAEALQYRYRQE